MNLNLNRTPAVLSLVLLYIFLISCSKDADLLSEYVINDDISQELQNLVVDDQFYLVSSNSMVLDVLNNDQFQNLEQVTITQTTDPQHGDIVINEDNTLTYTPNAPVTEEEPMEDTFVYTAEEVEEDGSVTEAQGTVTVSNDESNRIGNNLNQEVLKWKELYDNQFYSQDWNKIKEQATSGNKFQEYYYMAYYFDGLLSVWQATGDNKYLDHMLEVLDEIIKDAKPVSFNSSYLGWQADGSYNLDYPRNGVALWESYLWKVVTTMLRVMHQSPNLRTTSNYQQEYQRILEFTEKHIWEKWETKGNSNIYRNRTHMASHWARMGMELFIITGKQKYKTVFDNISFGKMPNVTSNLRNQIKANNSVPGAIIWHQNWGGNSIQDTAHAHGIISLLILANENNLYWNRDDIESLVISLDKVIFPAGSGPRYKYNVDGSGGNDAPGRLRDWIKLARYDRNLQERLKEQYLSDPQNASRYPTHSFGNMALNEKILIEGRPVYPEEY